MFVQSLKKKIFFRVANNSRIWNYGLNDAIGRNGWVLVFWRDITKNWWHFFLVWVRQRATILTKEELACETSIHQQQILLFILEKKDKSREIEKKKEKTTADFSTRMVKLLWLNEQTWLENINFIHLYIYLIRIL